MKPMLYLWGTMFKNRLKMSVRKPANLVAFIFFGVYFVFLLGCFAMAAGDMQLQSVDIAPTFSFFVMMYTPLNLAAYARRKGIIFKKADVNILFTSPIPPKMIMLYAKVRAAGADIVFCLFAFCAGIFIFHIPLWKMIIYVLFTAVLKQILETSLVLILYTSETLTKGKRRLISSGIYGILAALILILAVYVLTHDLHMLSVKNVMENPFFEMIPLIGWEISFIFLLFSKATVFNVVGSLLYLLTAVVLFIVAKKMKCQGEYYEDAMKFADDYAEAVKKSKKGEVAVVGKKKKYLQKHIEYKGTGAKAIFYRQLLEYKKNRFFIFGGISLLYLVVGVVIGVGASFIPEFSDVQEEKYLIIPAVMMYLAFILTNYSTKWAKELEQPLTFLIPDGAIKKLWYATLMEHIKAACDGLFVTIPAAIGMKLELSYVIFTVLFLVLLNAGKLYIELFLNVLLGKNVTRFLNSLVKMLFEAALFLMAIVGGVLGGLLTWFTSMLPILVGADVVLFITTMIMALLSSFLFDRMDCAD